MDRVMLGKELLPSVVSIPTDVIDKHLRDANESQLKIYLYLLRNSSDGMMSVENMADYFNYSIQDVERALRFWGLRGSLVFEGQEEKVVNFKKKPSYTTAQLNDFAKREDIKELLFVTEQYVGMKRGGGMNNDLISTILYMYDSLGFDKDLIINLFEYCVEHKKNKLYQIEAVANEWSEAGVKTLEDAVKLTAEVPKEAIDTLKAFGIAPSMRGPSDSEIKYVKKWTEEYGFSMDIIKVACDRTILRVHEPSFSYTNTILFGWYQAGVKTVSDIDRADKDYAAKKAAEDEKKAGSVKQITSKKSSKETEKTANNKFHNFEQRKYDFSQLEKEALWQ